jgi:hypothetical protein
MMNKENEKHLDRIINEAIILIDKKYTKGQHKHGGNLWEKSANQLLNEAIDEAVDQLVYLLTLKDKINE